MTQADAGAARTPGCALAFDHGGRRIGVAVAHRHPPLASAVTTLLARDGVPDWTEVLGLIAEWKPDGLVVGVPYNEPGTSASEAAAERFAAELERRTGLPVTRVDERLSSAEASDRLRQQRREGLRRRRVRPEDIDAEAARVIAETWLQGR